MNNNMVLLAESTMNRSYSDNRNRPVGARQRQIHPEKNRSTTEPNNSKNSL